MAIYKFLKDSMSGSDDPCGVLLKSDDPNHSGWAIPFDEDNRYYREYLAWVAEGNIPEPADTE